MAGTDRTKKSEATVTPGPAVILVAPQLGENIGTAARAMLNFGLSDLRLVRPRDGWPNERARAAASGADLVIDRVRLFDTTAEAVADLDYVVATTARSRDMVKPILTPETAAQ
ncbi:MAG: RNA methyltransferase, partial [Alphaproteobacteria bacterium]|nr:RNA methyltransferase [Alphaproteobacteria bacterium]